MEIIFNVLVSGKLLSMMNVAAAMKFLTCLTLNRKIYCSNPSGLQIDVDWMIRVQLSGAAALGHHSHRVLKRLSFIAKPYSNNFTFVT